MVASRAYGNGKPTPSVSHRRKSVIDEHWWTLREGTTILYVEWGVAHGTVFGTHCKLRKGPPVAIALSLDRNFRTTSSQTRTYLDATALADGGLSELRLVQISDEHILAGLWFLLTTTDDVSTPWRLLLRERGRTHDFDIDPEFRPLRDPHDLLLHVVAGSK